ncbi:hypothetical protein B0H14DRAFT_2366100, partial [Mycena olivaceomarginata]
AKKRPKEIADWVGRARNYTPAIADAEEFGKRFWGWWLDINPAWRTEERPMKREGGSVVVDSGLPWPETGFLNVLMCLKWWHDAMKEATLDWEDAVDDVSWVLGQMKE